MSFVKAWEGDLVPSRTPSTGPFSLPGSKEGRSGLGRPSKPRSLSLGSGQGRGTRSGVFVAGGNGVESVEFRESGCLAEFVVGIFLRDPGQGDRYV